MSITGTRGNRIMSGMDQLKIFRGEPYYITDKIIIKQPSLDEIVTYGEREYFSLVQTIAATPADKKVEIWDSLGIYWDEMSEYDLFLSISRGLRDIDASIIFPGLDFSSFRLVIDKNELILRNRDGVEIDKTIYIFIADFIRQIHNFTKNQERGFDNYTKQIMIEDDREEQIKAARKPFQSVLLPLISSLTNCADFKYRFDDVWTLPIGAFLDAVKRLLKYHEYKNLMRGVYAGTIDVKKINKKSLNWMS